MSEKNVQYDFCPKCGALARDGECQSCGYRLEGIKIKKQDPGMQTPNRNETFQSSQTFNEKPLYGSYAEQNYDNTSQGNPNAGQGYYNAGQSNPNAGQGYYNAGQSNPNAGQGYYNAGQSNPNAGQGYYNVNQDNSNAGQNNSYVNQEYNDSRNQGYGSNGQANNPNQGYTQTQGYGQNQGYAQNQGYSPNNNANQGYQPNYGAVPAYASYQPRKSKANAAIIIAFAVGFAILFVCITAGIRVYKNVLKTEQLMGEAIQEGENPAESIFGEEENGGDIQKEKGLGDEEEKRKEDGSTDAYKSASEDDYFLEPGYTSSWGGNHVNHTKAEFSGKYYNNICECIDYNVPYKINREYYEYISPDKNITIRMAYIQLEGDIPNLEQLNEQILSYSSYLPSYYFDTYSEDDIYDGWVEMYTDSYVVFNDENKMSIVLDENWNIDEDYSLDLYGINIDLETGIILDNNSIINFTDEFSADFRERSNDQNGMIEGMDALTDRELTDFLTDTSSSIIFYTPIGIEVGYNYLYEDSSGWVTASFPDYENYIKSF